MKWAIAAYAFMAGCLHADVLTLGPNFTKNAKIITDATLSLPATPQKILNNPDAIEELKLSKTQAAQLDKLAKQLPSIYDLQKRISERTGEPVLKLGEHSEEEMVAMTKKLKRMAIETNDELIDSLQEVLKPNQWSRFKQLVIQHELIRRRNSRLLRVPGAVIELTEDQRRKLAQGISEAEREIMRVELLKLRYLYFRRALQNVIGEDPANDALGKPFGFDVEIESETKDDRPNIRR